MQCCKGISEILADTARKIDVAARYGGEEFVLVLPETDAKGARVIAERLRKTVKKTAFPTSGGNLKVTLSLGIAIFPHDANNQSDLIACADAALYEAKGAGRDRLILYSDIAQKVAQEM